MSKENKQLQFPKMSRRDFIKAGFGYLAVEGLLLAGLLSESKKIDVNHYVYRNSLFPKEWDGTIIVQISDLHIGQRNKDPVTPDTIRELALQIQDYLAYIHADPTKIFLFDTGDAVCYFAKNGNESNIADLAESLKYLTQINANHMFAVEGNHDHAHSKSSEIAQLYRSAGFMYAGEDGLTADFQFPNISHLPFAVIAAPDFTTRREEWYKSEEAEYFLVLLERLPSEELTILLTHNPSMVDMWQEGRVAQILAEKNVIVFSGHTHGGQLHRVSPLQQVVMEVGKEVKHYDSKLIKGVYQFGSSMVNVNSGIGHAKGLRTLPPSFDVFEFRS
jgi:predicted MPP superfamily phosphohydrolase